MEQKIYATCGTCSKFINYEVDDEGRVHNVSFMGGCAGNTQGVARLVEGRPVKEVVSLLKGVRCGSKPTSCPDQLARALERELPQL